MRDDTKRAEDSSHHTPNTLPLKIITEGNIPLFLFTAHRVPCWGQRSPSPFVQQTLCATIAVPNKHACGIACAQEAAAQSVGALVFLCRNRGSLQSAVRADWICSGMLRGAHRSYMPSNGAPP